MNIYTINVLIPGDSIQDQVNIVHDPTEGSSLITVSHIPDDKYVSPLIGCMSQFWGTGLTCTLHIHREHDLWIVSGSRPVNVNFGEESYSSDPSCDVEITWHYTGICKQSMNTWHQEVTEHTFDFKPEGKWIVKGWYEDEKASYQVAEAAWNKRQQDGWDAGITAVTVTSDSGETFSLDIVDDYFHWNVETPHWYLHKDGTWGKLLCKLDEVSRPYSGEYLSEDQAEQHLANSQPPERFPDYSEHLRSAEPPISCGEEPEK